MIRTYWKSHTISACLLLAIIASATAQQAANVDSAIIIILSEPEKASIFLNNKETVMLTPAELKLPVGEYVIELVFADHDPLATRIKLAKDQTVTATFPLKPFPPPPVTPDQLGLKIIPSKPLLDEQIAARLKKRWRSVTETFLIVPLGQGLLAKLLLADENQSEANALILTGVGLTVGSYLLGSVFHRRKLHQIRKRNEEIPLENEQAKAANLKLDELVKSSNTDLVKNWLLECEGKGKVKITVAQP